MLTETMRKGHVIDNSEMLLRRCTGNIILGNDFTIHLTTSSQRERMV